MTTPRATAATQPSGAVDAGLLDLLAQIVGAENLSTAAAVREQHGRDESYHPSAPPDAVVYCTETDQVAAVVRACAERGVPVIPFGTGTSLEGHVAALSGGICIDLSRMDKILTVNAEDMDVTVQAGVRRKALNDYLRDTGLFFPIDPGADASLGGMTATRASGTNAVRYGTMRENVLSLTVVMADGRVIRTARRARKSSAGYDLTRLFVGSEGTLGVITEVTLRLYGIPEAVVAAVCPFPDLESAVNTVILTIQSGIPVARIELLDEAQMDAVNKYSKLDYAVKPTLFFEFHGSDAGVREQVENVKAIAADFGADDFQWATKAEDRNKLWQARHDAYYAAIALRPGCRGIATDVCVPISKLAECILETRKDIDASGLCAPIVGHVGDGNFHIVFVVDPDNADEMARAESVNERMVMRAIAMDGTCTGEHGVGYGKIDFLTAEHGEALVAMRAVKQALDPQNIMNPGKIVRV
ncbi:FAD-linked oxidase C-terminal domain-containing protein [Thalassospiraceae bacterium LMO-SO8]|nr:FAD-binding protein [Alphaproteobacteria bacterium LMO-S08]WND74655.1 FAD-linked oxidase C-terminal domain-containing protein [Thalassospiraceae bacterium LMO-SO8]